MMERHALALADMNGDGREHLITGERFLGHGAGDAGGNPLVLEHPTLLDCRRGAGVCCPVGDVTAPLRFDLPRVTEG